MSRLRRKIANALDVNLGPRPGLSWANRMIVGLIAMPAGILASAFSEAIQRRNASKNGKDGAEVSKAE